MLAYRLQFWIHYLIQALLKLVVATFCLFHAFKLFVQMSLWVFDSPFLLVELRYAYAVASAFHGAQHIHRKDFMVQVWSLTCEGSLKLCWKLFFSMLIGSVLNNSYIFYFSAPMGYRNCDYNMKAKLHSPTFLLTMGNIIFPFLSVLMKSWYFILSICSPICYSYKVYFIKYMVFVCLFIFR